MDEQPVIPWRVVLYAILITVVMLNALPFIGGLYYMTTGSHPAEQEWLDDVIAHLKVLKTRPTTLICKTSWTTALSVTTRSEPGTWP